MGQMLFVLLIALLQGSVRSEDDCFSNIVHGIPRGFGTNVDSVEECQTFCREREERCFRFYFDSKTETQGALNCFLQEKKETESSLTINFDEEWTLETWENELCDWHVYEDWKIEDKEVVQCQGHPKCIWKSDQFISGPSVCPGHTPCLEPITTTTTSTSTMTSTVPSTTAPLSNEDCSDFTLDVLLLQDVTESFQIAIDNFASAITSILDNFETNWPGSQFGLSTFGDKPVGFFGWPTDYCFKSHLPIGSTVQEIEAEMSSLISSGGLDWPENQLGAIWEAVHNPAVNWSMDAQRNGKPVKRLVILITNSLFHESGAVSIQFPELPSFEGRADCATEDYPSREQIRDLVQDQDISVLFIVSQDYDLVDFVSVEDDYKDLLDDLGIAGAVESMNLDGSEIMQSIAKAMESYQKSMCPDTEAPTRTLPEDMNPSDILARIVDFLNPTNPPRFSIPEDFTTPHPSDILAKIKDFLNPTNPPRFTIPDDFETPNPSDVLDGIDGILRPTNPPRFTIPDDFETPNPSDVLDGVDGILRPTNPPRFTIPDDFETPNGILPDDEHTTESRR